MKRNVLTVIAVCLVAMLWAGAVPAHGAVTKKDKRKARLAANYLVENQASDGSFGAFSLIGSTSDAILSLVAARRSGGAIRRAVTYLENNADQVLTVGEKAKVILALRAADKPLELGDRDLIAEIEAAQQPNGQYGDDLTGVLSHALAMLALATHQTPADPDATQWLLDARCAGGGWQYDLSSQPGDDADCGNDGEWDATADTNTTSYAIQALAFAPAGTSFPRKFRFLRSVRDKERGGWGYSREFAATETNSTALAIQAFRSHGVKLPPRSKKALRDLQFSPCSPHRAAFGYTWEFRNGKFRRSPDAPGGATIAGILGLLERPLPIRYFKVNRPAPKPRCG